mmetsp:Transcript_37917/g.118859  ORF Transcript_37917/g.118859 Transcript_37917/m.118859 type:complete len:480 (-) Transcript_37917:314-1753(-)
MGDKSEEIDAGDDAGDYRALDLLAGAAAAEAALLGDDEGVGLAVEGVGELGERRVQRHLLKALVHGALDGVVGLEAVAGEQRGEVALRDDAEDLRALRDDGDHVNALLAEQVNGVGALHRRQDRERRLQVEFGHAAARPPGHARGPADDLVVHEAVLEHPRVAEELGHVVAHRVRQDGHDALVRGQRLGELDCGGDGGAAAAAAEQALLADEAARHDEALVVVRLDPLVHDLAVQHLGDEVVAGALYLVALEAHLVVERVRDGEDAALGVHRDDLDVREALLELPRDARERAARARADDDVVEVPAALAQDLLGRAVVVRERVARVAVLVQDVRVGQVALQPPRDADVRLGGVEGGLGGRADDLRAERLEHVHLLLAHLLRERDDHAVALDGRGEREADARVPARRLDERVAGLDAALLLGVLHHALADAVLDGAARVEELALEQQLALDALIARDAVAAHQRRVPDGAEHAVQDAVRL